MVGQTTALHRAWGLTGVESSINHQASQDRHPSDSQEYRNKANEVVQLHLTGHKLPNFKRPTNTPQPTLINAFKPEYITELLLYSVNQNLLCEDELEAILSGDDKALKTLLTKFLSHFDAELNTHSENTIKEVVSALEAIIPDCGSEFLAECKDVHNRLWSYNIGIDNALSSDGYGEMTYGENSAFPALRLTKSEYPSLAPIDYTQMSEERLPSLIHAVRQLSHLAMKTNGLELLDDEFLAETDFDQIRNLFNKDPSLNQKVFNKLKLETYDDENFTDVFSRVYNDITGVEPSSSGLENLSFYAEYATSPHIALYHHLNLDSASKRKCVTTTKDKTDLEKLCDTISSLRIMNIKDSTFGLDKDYSSNLVFGRYSIISFGTDTEQHCTTGLSEAFMNGDTFEEEALGLRPNEDGLNWLKNKTTAELWLIALFFISEKNCIN